MFHKRLDRCSYQISCPGYFSGYFIRGAQVFANLVALGFASTVDDSNFLAFLHAVADLSRTSVSNGMIHAVFGLGPAAANVTNCTADSQSVDIGHVAARSGYDRHLY